MRRIGRKTRPLSGTMKISYMYKYGVPRIRCAWWPWKVSKTRVRAWRPRRWTRPQARPVRGEGALSVCANSHPNRERRFHSETPTTIYRPSQSTITGTATGIPENTSNGPEFLYF